MIWEPLNLGELAPDAVRVRVGASGINFAETRMRAEDYSGQELPFVMGMEVAGSVEQVGRQVADFSGRPGLVACAVRMLKSLTVIPPI